MRFVLATDRWLDPTSSGAGLPDPPPGSTLGLFGLVVDFPFRRPRRPSVVCLLVGLALLVSLCCVARP